MNPEVLEECEKLAFANKINFPQVVARLTETGVERYCADLVRLEKFYYSRDGQTLTQKMPLKDAVEIGERFLPMNIKEAIATSQQAKIDYPEFLRQIMKAGVVYYDVFVNGRKVIYTGRDGDFHVEVFSNRK